VQDGLQLSHRPPLPEDIRAIQLCIREIVMGTERRSTKPGSRRFWEHGGGRAESTGVPVLTADRWGRVAPFLTTGNGRSWRRLPELRKRVRSWEEYLDRSVRAEHWPAFLFDACCARPEEVPQQGQVSKQRRHVARAKVAAALANTALLPTESEPASLRPSDDDFEPGYPYREVVQPENGHPPPWFSYDDTFKSVAQGKVPDLRNWVTAGLMKVVHPQNRWQLSVVVQRWRAHHPDDYMVGLACDEIMRERTDPEGCGQLAGLLICSVKAAIWHRANGYLTAYGRASKDELTPAQRRAVFVQPSWLEVHADEDLALMLRSLAPDPLRQKNTKGQGDRQLAAALELASDDLAIVNLLDTTRSHDDEWNAQRAAETILDQLVIFLRQGPDLDEMLFRRTTAQSSGLLRINPPPRPGPKLAGIKNRSQSIEPPSRRWLDHIADLASDRPLRPGALGWVDDPTNTQSMMAYLRSADDPRRPALTLGFLTALTRSISSAARRDPSLLRGQMRVVNSAAWDVAAAGDTRLFRFSEPLLDAVRPTDSPFVATLYRCQATLATKSLQHIVAFNQILRAEHAIRDARETIANDADDLCWVNYIEAFQQVLLQKAGAEIRALEALLTSPHHKTYVPQSEARELRKFAEDLSDACIQDSGLAYHYLAILEQEPLPATPQIGRVSTVAWRFNTRFQAARAAVLNALVLMATNKPPDIQLAIAAQYYREATAAAEATSQLCLLTQIALTYALITGGRFLAPANLVHTTLPPHLTTPWADDGGLFDWETASRYLSHHRFSAGVMATLTWPAARIAMRRVEHPEVYPAWLAHWAGGSMGDLRQQRNTGRRQ